jgi:cytochrome c5
MKLTLILVIGMACALFGESAWPDRKDDGREAYEASCAQCHRTGVDGAPATGNPEDWANRSHLWEAVLFEHANNGYFGMPAKGGKKQLSEYDVDVAAEYMLDTTHPDLPRD